MSPERVALLIQGHPSLYALGAKRIEFRCRDGWFDLLRILSERLDEIGDVQVQQVKEKFGELRVYTNAPYPSAAWEATEDAMRGSRSICERCGIPSGSRRMRGNWIVTECDECIKRDP